ncbi:MAG: hypothetical protein AMJ46_11895 [Latescibacteria bacterium DG_63]|nr:MAG: hypothetical protein AMJ46_11895 [Latescibacteria bacterium DG_63]
MLTKRLCILLILLFTLSVIAARLTAGVTSPEDVPCPDKPAFPDELASSSDRASPSERGSTSEGVSPEECVSPTERASADERAAADAAASPSDAALPDDTPLPDDTTPLEAGASPSHLDPTHKIGRELEEIAYLLENVLPESWEITSIRRSQVPRKWTGSPEAILVKLEDPSIVVHHPRGFEYHPFYKIWLCPPRWEGAMEEVEFLGDDGPSVLLGQNHKMKVFYLTLGANNWPEGAARLREALDLTALPITDVLRQKIDPAMRIKLSPGLAGYSNGISGLLSRIVGMEKEGPLVYLEYATATERRIDGQVLPSRCREPHVVRLMERENLFLANKIFLAYPEVETIYLRRVCDAFLSDRVINRADETSDSPFVVSNSSH